MKFISVKFHPSLWLRTSHVDDVFHVKNSRANLVIRELTASGILGSPHYGTYRFFKTE